jgi:hypothetical protein
MPSFSCHPFHQFLHCLLIMTNFSHIIWLKLINKLNLSDCILWILQMFGMIFSISLCRNLADGLAQGRWGLLQTDLVKNLITSEEERAPLLLTGFNFFVNNCKCCVFQWLFDWMWYDWSAFVCPKTNWISSVLQCGLIAVSSLIYFLYIVHTVHFHLITHFLNQQNAHFLFIIQYNFFFTVKSVQHVSVPYYGTIIR